MRVSRIIEKSAFVLFDLGHEQGGRISRESCSLEHVSLDGRECLAEKLSKGDLS